MAPEAKDKEIEAIVIHLARAESRKPQVEKLIQATPVPAVVLDAVDAQKLTSEDLSRYRRRPLFPPSYPFRLKTTEIACFLSHRKAWQHIVDRNLFAGLVLEDDVYFDDDHFHSAWMLALKHIQPDRFIRLPYKERERPGDVVERDNGTAIFEPQHVALGMQAQLVGRSAAEVLLRETAVFDRPVDTAIQVLKQNRHKVLVVLPSGVTEHSGELAGSTVQFSGMTLLNKLTREIARLIYRTKLRLWRWSRNG